MIKLSPVCKDDGQSPFAEFISAERDEPRQRRVRFSLAAERVVG